MRSVNRHFPPVTHRWSCQLPEINPLVPPALLKPATGPGSLVTGSGSSGTGIAPHSFGLPSKVFKHELLQVVVAVIVIVVVVVSSIYYLVIFYYYKRVFRFTYSPRDRLSQSPL